MTKAAEKAAPAFDLSELDAVDQSAMEVCRRDGSPTGWKWYIAGPGHPQAVALRNRLNKEAIKKEREQEEARVNGRKYKADVDSPDQVFQRRIELLADRVVGWDPIKLHGQDFPFSRESAIALLLDPNRGDTLVTQVAAFLQADDAFMQRSEKS